MVVDVVRAVSQCQTTTGGIPLGFYNETTLSLFGSSRGSVTCTLVAPSLNQVVIRWNPHQIHRMMNTTCN